jgi:hypothetical protein
VELADEWEAHRGATIASLAPSGYIETILAERVALLFWRLGRVVRYETENAASLLETAEEDLASSLESFSQRLSTSSDGWVRPVTGATPAQIQEELAMRLEKATAFVALREYEPDAPFPPEHAQGVLAEVARRADVELDDVDLPFLPNDADDVGWDKWSGWTKKLVLDVVAAVCAASSLESYREGKPDEAWRACGAMAEADVRFAAHALRDAEARLRRSVRSRTLLSADRLDKVARYEAHLERSLYKALRELQRLQALRSGDPRAVPVALNVDVSLSRRAEDHAIDTTGEDAPL